MAERGASNLSSMDISMHEYWSFFRTIDEDLHQLRRFVEFSEANFSTYSVELVRLYLSIGSEVDVVAKLLCGQIDSSKQPKKITEYRPIITGQYPLLADLDIHIRGTAITLKPWSGWNSASPTWWTKYNDVKHKRHLHFKDARLEHVLNAAGGLLVLLVYASPKELFRRKPTVIPIFQVLELDHRYVAGPMRFGLDYNFPDLGTHSNRGLGIQIE
jgi:hypothetical protein